MNFFANVPVADLDRSKAFSSAGGGRRGEAGVDERLRVHVPAAVRGPGDGLAAALEVVGQRWALLVVRSLLDGPKRYGDLQRELGAPTNILAIRLKELKEAGVLHRLPLAHNQRAYALTERGAGLREAIDALGRRGARGR